MTRYSVVALTLLRGLLRSRESRSVAVVSSISGGWYRSRKVIA